MTLTAIFWCNERFPTRLQSRADLIAPFHHDVSYDRNNT